MAKHLGCVHHECVFTITEAIDALSDVIYHLETFDVTTIRAGTPMYLMARRIKATGVLSSNSRRLPVYIFYILLKGGSVQKKEMGNENINM